MFATHHVNDWIGYLLFAPVILVPIVWAYAIRLWAMATDTNRPSREPLPQGS